MTAAIIILLILIALFGIVLLAMWLKARQIDKQYPDTRETRTVSKDEIKQLFYPYVEMTTAPGGIDRTKQQYWAGTICVYAPSLAEIFKMMNKPLSEYKITVDDPKRMKKDGSIPEDLLTQYIAEKKAAAAESANSETSTSSKDMEALWEAIKRLEKENKELHKKLEEELDK